MTDDANTPGMVRPEWLPWLMFGAIAANIFAIVTINYWIYYARAAFIATHPDYVAVQPPTISRAISDPVIGEPFSFWLTLSAIALIPGVFGISLAYARVARRLPTAARRASLMLTLFAIALLACQAVSSVGIYITSSYRFPDHNETHMVGSYIFFVAQWLVSVMFVLLGATALRSKSVLAMMENTGQARRGWMRFRLLVGILSFAMTLGYMALFLIKTMDFGAANDLIYTTYVLAEPMVISMFLLVLALLQTDLWAIARGRQRPRGKNA